MTLKGSKIFGGAIAALVNAITFPLGQRHRTKIRAYAAERLVPIYQLKTPRGHISFACPTRAAARMPISFFHLEPETRRWLDEYVKPGETLWDVGANIGTFALYAAHVRQAKVVAFEPSAQTYGLLSKNIYLNHLGDSVSAFAVALGDSTEAGTFYLNRTEAGEALNSYGTSTNIIGAFDAAFSQRTLCFEADRLAKQFNIGTPDHLKIDVDGNELKVLKGAKRLLANVSSVLIEVDQGRHDLTANDAIIDFLRLYGFSEDDRLRSTWNRVFYKNT